MASIAARSTLTRTSSMSNWVGVSPRQLLLPQPGVSAAAVNAVQVATMRATYGEPYPYKAPWPYQTKRFRLWHEIFGMFTGEKSLDRCVLTDRYN